MLSIERFFFRTTPPTMKSQECGDDTDEATRVRAVNTILALSALFGGENLPKTKTSTSATTVEKHSVAAWSNESLADRTPSKEFLAGPMECPPFTDPSSVVIADQESLEFELEEPESNLLLFGTTAAKDTNDGASSASSTASSRRVRFRDMVAVVEIPSHRDMDAETIGSIWTSVDEVHANAQRNSMEYRADGRDWTAVKEEEDMIMDPVSGELVHPATWQYALEEAEYQRNQEEDRKRLRRAMAAAAEAERIRAAEVLANSNNGTTNNKKSKGKRRSPKQQHRKDSSGTQRRPEARQKGVPSLTRFSDT